MSEQQPHHNGAQFLHDINSSLHYSPVVELAAQQARLSGERIPNNPQDKIANYLGNLANRHSLFGEQIDSERKKLATDRIVDTYLVKSENIPENYFRLQARIARERGHGDIEFGAEARAEAAETLRADQKASLTEWVDYLNDKDAMYPMWFKRYAFEGVTNLGKFDKQKRQFPKRSAGTVTIFPELNREALAYVYDNLSQGRVDGKKELDYDVASLVSNGKFSKLYGDAFLRSTANNEKHAAITKGEWVTFGQSNDPTDGEALADSLQGFGTGWCTAGTTTATEQLQYGDFHVYYSEDENGQPIVPRLAVRMDGGKVAEVRGVMAQQHIEGNMVDIAAEKVKQLPGGEEYYQKAEDMQRVTKLEAASASGEALSPSDVRFLYQIDRSIEGFGYREDPRIQEILSSRDLKTDLHEIFGTKDETQILLNLFETQYSEDGTGFVNRNGHLIDRAKRQLDLDANRLITTLFDRIEKSGTAHTVPWMDLRDSLPYVSGVNEANMLKLIQGNFFEYDGLILRGDEPFLADSVDEEAQSRMLDQIPNYNWLKLVAFMPESQQKIFDELSVVAPDSLAEKADKFDRIDTASKLALFDKLSPYLKVYNLPRFPEVDANALAETLFDQDESQMVFSYLKNFNSLGQGVLNRFMTAENSAVSSSVAEHLNRFKDVDQMAFAKHLIALGNSRDIVDKVGNFDPSIRPQLAELAMQAGDFDALAWTFYKFTGADERIATELEAKGFRVNRTLPR